MPTTGPVSQSRTLTLFRAQAGGTSLERPCSPTKLLKSWSSNGVAVPGLPRRAVPAEVSVNRCVY